MTTYVIQNYITGIIYDKPLHYHRQTPQRSSVSTRDNFPSPRSSISSWECRYRQTSQAASVIWTSLGMKNVYCVQAKINYLILAVGRIIIFWQHITDNSLSKPSGSPNFIEFSRRLESADVNGLVDEKASLGLDSSEGALTAWKPGSHQSSSKIYSPTCCW